MNEPHQMPHWQRELLRLAQYKTQIYLFGNIADTVVYPADAGCTRFRLGPLREALFALLAMRLPDYAIIASYSFIDGLHFADELGENQMAGKLTITTSAAAQSGPTSATTPTEARTASIFPATTQSAAAWANSPGESSAGSTC